ncbi:MAG: peptide ABC transporter substrate-binding protein [Gammaproteobacteria bacterium]|nr:peptide ABC transporter substrate-binding protein [Gammaproteobacteria bacterium]
MKRSPLIVLFLCLSVAACGDLGPSVDSGQVLHRGTGEEPESLDVHKSNSTEAGHVQRDLGEGLVGYTPDGALRRAAAEHWEISDDGTEYTFVLRPDGRWSNGDPVTAEDFVYSYRRLVDPATAALYTASVSSVANAPAIMRGEASADTLAVEAVTAQKLRITLTQPVPYFLALLAHPSMFPVHRPSIEVHGDQHARPGNLVTNGAYRLVAWEIGSYIEIERNEHYWDNDNTSIDRVRHYVTPQPMVELNRYRASELHITRTIPPGMFQEMKNQRPNQVRVSPALGVYYYGFNLDDEKFANNPNLREALSTAIDRETIVSLIGRGEAPAFSWVPPGTANYDPQVYSWSRMSKGERELRAQQLYQAAGYGPDNPFTTTIRYNTQETHEQIAVAIQSMWRTVLGVEASLINEEFQVLLSNVQEGNMEIYRLNWNGDYNDAHTFLATLESNNSSNFTRYASEEFDDLMKRAARQVDPSARKLFLEEAERHMLRDYPLIPVYFYINRSMVSPQVSGWGDNVLNYHYSQHLSLAVDE